MVLEHPTLVRENLQPLPWGSVPEILGFKWEGDIPSILWLLLLRVTEPGWDPASHPDSLCSLPASWELALLSDSASFLLGLCNGSTGRRNERIIRSWNGLAGRGIEAH